MDAVARTIELDTGEKRYSLNEETATLVVRPRGWHLVEKHATLDGDAGEREPVRLRPLRLPLRTRAARRRQRAVLLPAEARVAPRGAPLARRVLARGGAARARSRRDPRDGADRDDSRRVRDGRDPPRARRARDRSQRRPLGLHLQRHQEARPPRGVPVARPRRRDDGGAVHAFVRRPAGQDVPPARRARDRRHGGVHPLAPRSGGERGGAGEGARGQAARVGPGLRRDVGRASRSRLRRAARVRAREPARRHARRRAAERRSSPRRALRRLVRRRRRPAAERERRHPVHRVVAERRRRGGDRQPDGGRSDRGDLALADLAVAAPRAREPRRGARDDRRRDEEARRASRGSTRRASCSSRWRSTTASSSS